VTYLSFRHSDSGRPYARSIALPIAQHALILARRVGARPALMTLAKALQHKAHGAIDTYVEGGHPFEGTSPPRNPIAARTRNRMG